MTVALHYAQHQLRTYDQEERMDKVLSDYDVDAINQVRVLMRQVVRDLERQPGPDDRARGRVAAYADVAGDALFDLLNIADTYLDLHLSAEALHGPTRAPLRNHE